MSCSASADLSQDMLLSTFHSSKSYSKSFGSFLPRCSEEQGYLQSLQNGLFLQRLLNDCAETTSRHQTVVRSEAEATPNTSSDNYLNQLN